MNNATRVIKSSLIPSKMLIPNLRKTTRMIEELQSTLIIQIIYKTISRMNGIKIMPRVKGVSAVMKFHNMQPRQFPCGVLRTSVRDAMKTKLNKKVYL